MAAPCLEAGRMVRVRYHDEPNLWMERMILCQSSPAMVLKVTEVVVPPGSSPWWILTPDGDVYPELLEASADIVDVIVGDDEGKMKKKAGQTGPSVNRVHKFQADREAGEPNLLLLMRARAEAERMERESRQPLEAGGGSDSLLPLDEAGGARGLPVPQRLAHAGW